MHGCPVNGGLSEWSVWTTCDATCGGGNQMRNRQCDNPTPVNRGADCVGVKSETQGCNMQRCPECITNNDCSKQTCDTTDNTCKDCSEEILGQYYSDIRRSNPSFQSKIENGNIVNRYDAETSYTVVITDDKSCSGDLHAVWDWDEVYTFTYDVSNKLMYTPFFQEYHYREREIKVADDDIQYPDDIHLNDDGIQSQ